MLPKFTCQISGVKKITLALGATANAAKDMTSVWDSVARYLTGWFEVLFTREGSVAGWPGWSYVNEAYGRRKLAQGYGSRILVRTGRLRDSMTQIGHANYVRRITPSQLVVGTNVRYAAFHEWGTKNMPARSLTRLTKAAGREIMRVIQAGVLSAPGGFRRKTL